MKSKNAPQSPHCRLLKYIPLLIALGIVGAWIWLILYASRFPNRHDGAVLFYPLVQLAANFNLFAVVCTLVMILHGVAIMRDCSKILTALSFLGLSAVLVFWFFLGSLETAHLKDYDAKVVNGHLYRLVYIPNGEIWGYSNPIEALTVLECDEAGLWCQYYSTPYLKYASRNFPQDGRLELDSLTHDLLLHIGQEIIDVEANDHFKICDELYKQHTDHDRNIDTQGYVCG
jgi:hypothetical protein